MNCEQIENQDLVRLFLNDDLSGESRTAFKAHCAECEACQSSIRLAASLMLLPPVPLRQVERVREPEPERVSLLESLRSWLFPSGVGHWQPALAFAAVILVAIPVLQRVWIPTPPDVNGQVTLRGSEGPVSVASQTRAALGALNGGDARKAFDLLGAPGVQWDDARMAEVREAYRVRARAAADLGQVDDARSFLNKAKQLTMLDAAAESCIAQDLKALEGVGEYCPLPAL